MTISAKQRFLQDANRAAVHRELVVSDKFLIAAEAALLQVVADLPDSSSDPNVAVAGFNRVLGAREYLKALLNLAEQPRVPSRTESFNLNHKL